MKKLSKLIARIDAIWSFVIPLIACGYLVYHEAEYWARIILVGWLLFLLHGVALISTFSVSTKIFPSLLSLISMIALLAGLGLGYIDWEGFLMLELIAEATAYVVAILIFVISNRKINGEPFWKKMGPGIAVMNLIILSLVLYPFIRQWMIFIQATNDKLIYWVGAGLILLVASLKKMTVLRNVVEQVNGQIKRKKEPEIEKEVDIQPEETDKKKKFKILDRLPIIFLISWFVVMILLVNIN